MMKSNNDAIQGCIRHESSLLTLHVKGICRDSVSETLLHARYDRLSVTFRYLYIDISLTKGILAKQRPSAITRLAEARKSAGSSSEKNTRVATPRAFT